MRVTGATGPMVRSPDGSGARATAATGFSLPGPRPASPTGAAGTASAASALLGLQDVALPGADRRRRAVRRGQSLLDRLDELRLGLLDGEVPAAALHNLRAELGRTGEPEEDEGLRGLLHAIEVRCAVELAKRQADATG